jgi:hypothetical protein
MCGCGVVRPYHLERQYAGQAFSPHIASHYGGGALRAPPPSTILHSTRKICSMLLSAALSKWPRRQSKVAVMNCSEERHTAQMQAELHVFSSRTISDARCACLPDSGCCRQALIGWTIWRLEFDS